MRKVSPVTGTEVYPGSGWQITSEYVDADYQARFGDWHTGHDLSRYQALGMPIYAATDGEVRMAENVGNNGFGNLVFIRHQPQLFTRYGHLQAIHVQRGQNVRAGDVIGLLGNTGRSTGPHLHFDVMRKSNALDWPGIDRARLLREYVNPHDWYREATVPQTVTPNVSDGLSGTYRVTATFGVNVRTDPNTNAGILRIALYGETLNLTSDRFQGPRYTWRKLADSGWVVEMYVEPFQGSAPSSAAPVTATPPIATPSSIASAPIALRGVHGNTGGWSPRQEELDCVKRNNVQSMLIIAYQTGQSQAVNQFRNAGVKDFVIRAAQQEPVVSPNPDVFVAKTLPALREYHSAIGNSQPFWVVIHNEPNYGGEGYQSAWFSGAQFASWFVQVAARYRQEFPNIKIGFPAMSPGGTLNGEHIRLDDREFLADCREAIAVSDWLSVHAYYVGDGNDIDIRPTYWRSIASGKPIIITEAGPANGIVVTKQAVENVYAQCHRHDLPTMAWTLSSAGVWDTASWVDNNL